jgi:hypothetical protein
MKFKHPLLKRFDPIKQTAAFLAVMALFASAFKWSQAGTQILLHALVTVGFSFVLFHLYTKGSKALGKPKRKSLYTTLITALIIFLVMHYGTETADLIYPLAATFIAITHKFFFTKKGSPLINPAVLAMLIVGGVTTALSTWAPDFMPNLSPAFISWWGASFKGWFSLALLALWIVFGLKKWRKYRLLASFLIAHFILMVLQGQDFSLIHFTFTDSTIYFLAAIMLAEPKTSPSIQKQQTYYGFVAAALYNIFFSYSLPYFSLLALAGANLVKLSLKKPKAKKSPATRGVERSALATSARSASIKENAEE